MDSTAYKYRLYCTTNSEGEFTFPNLKPGKYILYGLFEWRRARTGWYSGEAISERNIFMKTVEIKPGKKTVKVKLIDGVKSNDMKVGY